MDDESGEQWEKGWEGLSYPQKRLCSECSDTQGDGGGGRAHICGIGQGGISSVISGKLIDLFNDLFLYLQDGDHYTHFIGWS